MPFALVDDETVFTFWPVYETSFNFVEKLRNRVC